MIQLYNGDCLEVMTQIPDGSVDMILCDLPYGTTACKWDTIIPFEPLWAHYERVIKRNGAIVLTASQPFTSRLVMSKPEWFRYEWIWDKKLGTGHLNAKKQPLKRHEAVLIFAKGPAPYNPEMRTGMLRNKSPKRSTDNVKGRCYGTVNHKGDNFTDQYYPTTILEISNAVQTGKVHPTQKPVALMEYLIRTYTNEGETVLDNCMGSGTTGAACINTGRSFIGIEKDPQYFQIAQQRILKIQEQPKQLGIVDSAPAV